MNKMNATDGKYVILHDWMNQLGLSASEKIALALVCGYTMKEGCSCVKNACVQEWLGCTKKTAINVMDSLEEKGLIIRGQEIINGKIANTYKLGEEKLLSMGVKITPQGCKNYTVRVKNLHPKGEKITPYKDNNKDNIISLSETRTREKETLKIWLTENAPGTESIVMRNKIAIKDTSIGSIVEALEPYIEQYCTEQLEWGKGDLSQRGRSDVLQHFSIRIQAYINQEKKDKEEPKSQPIKQKQNGTNQQDLIAELRKRRRAKESSQL